MKRFFRSFMLTAVAAMGIVACDEAPIDEVSPVVGGTTITANTPTSTQTKMSFTDNDTEGISIVWELGDTFSVYESYEGTYVCDFSCTDAASGKFTSNENLLLNRVAYTAVYPASTQPYLWYALMVNLTSVQNGDEINQLDAACMMTAWFTYYTEDDDVSTDFEHKKAVMTFEFESDERPAYLVFENGDDSYKVNYTSIEPVDGIYTSHIIIEPCEATERTLTFTLYNSDDIAYDIRSVTSSKAYVAGCRYTAPVSDCAEVVTFLSGGYGTEAKPYLISTVDDLKTLATKVNEGTSYSGTHFKMTQDIDLGGETNPWTPIGSLDSDGITIPFSGTFDGGGCTISGLYFNNDDENNLCLGALFACVNGGTIKNVTVEGTVLGYVYLAGIVADGLDATIENCCNKVNVTNRTFISSIYSASYSPPYNIAGIIAYGKNCTITSCCNFGTIYGFGADTHLVGGIAASILGGEISDCYNRSTVYGSLFLGGIVGGASGVEIKNCYNASSVTQYNIGSIYLSTYFETNGCSGLVGVFAGCAYGSSTKITNSYWVSDIDGLPTDALGSGYFYGDLMESATDNVELTSKTESDMKNGSFASTLGENWKEDEKGINGGYPILSWQ